MMKLMTLSKIKNYIKYKSPWRYITYSKQLYKNENFRIEYIWRRESHFCLGIYYDGNMHTEVWSNNENWFVNELYINFIFITILIVTKKRFYYKYTDDYFKI